MKSPTSTILHSIQALKTRLRSDHLQLQGIRRDFAMGPTKSIQQCEERQQSPLAMPVPNRSLQKNTRTKLLELRKSHRAEIQSLLQAHKTQKQQLIFDYENKMQQMTGMLEEKIKEQEAYIAMLEEQVQADSLALGYRNDMEMQTSFRGWDRKGKQGLGCCSRVVEISVGTEMTFDNKINYQLFHSPQESKPQQVNKYQKIVNKLLHENAVLLQNVQTLKMQYRKLIHHSKIQQDQLAISKQMQSRQSRESQYFSMVPLTVQPSISESSYRSAGIANKNRLKFSKASERIRTQTDRSYASINNQNIDTSNLQFRQANSIEKYSEADSKDRIQNSIVEEEEESILCQEMKLKTIKHFMKAASHRSTQCEDYNQGVVMVPVMQEKRAGAGIRNALKRISIL